MTIKTTIYRIALTVWAIAAATATIQAAATVSPDTIKARLDYQRYVYPQEKIHVTTDQGRYVAGDTIWLRAWVTDAATGHQVSASKYVYVELLTPTGEVEHRIKIREEDGTYTGYVALDEEMAEGVYTLAAYTTFMESLGSDYFFRKRLGVVSPYSARAQILTEATPADGDEAVDLSVTFADKEGKPIHYEKLTVTLPGNKIMDGGRGDRTRHFKIKRKDCEGRVALVQADKYRKYVVLPGRESAVDLTFHPEGGWLVPGASCKVGFKAIDGSGAGRDVSGAVVNSRGDTVATFQSIHRGMGTLVLIPEEGETYTALTDIGRYQLPQVNSRAAVVHADMSKPGRVDITTAGDLPEGAMIVVQSHGTARYAGAAEKGRTVRLPTSDLGEGVVQILLLTADMQPLSERLIFVYPEPTTSLIVTGE